jgi:hypothetical protein
MSTDVLEVETPSKENCFRCDNKGFIVSVMAMGPQGPALFEIRPDNPNMEKIKAKDITFSKCDCVLGNDFAVIKDK